MADKKPKKAEAEVVTALDQCIVELTQLLAQACGGQVLLNPELSPHLAAHVQRVTGKQPILPVLAPTKEKGEGDG